MSSAADFRAWITSDEPFKLSNASPALAARPLVPHHLGTLLGHLDTLCGSEVDRRLFLRFLFANEDNNLLHVRYINALFYWLCIRPDGDGKWVVTNPRAAATAQAVLAEARLAGEQIGMGI